MTKIILLSLVIFILLGVVPLIRAESTPPIGCESYNSTVIKAWNQGDIENTTYYHIDGIQLANRIDRFEWAIYDVGFAYYHPILGKRIVSFYDLPFYFKGCKTDNLTYYSLSWQANFTAGIKRANLSFTYSQLLEDDYVNMTYELDVGVNGWSAWDKEVWFWRKLRAINIDDDGDIDVLSYYNDSGAQGHHLNLTSDLWHYNTSQDIRIGDIDDNGVILWKWNNLKRDIFLKNAGANANSRVWWFVKSPINLTAGFHKKMTEWWIDAPACIMACPFGIRFGGFRVYCNNTGVFSDATCNSWPDTLNFQLVDQVNHIYFFMPGFCNYGAGCLLNTTSNSTGATPPEEILYKTSQTEDRLVCDSYDESTCEQDTIQHHGAATSWSRHYNLTCRKAEDLNIDAYFEFQRVWSLNTLQVKCPQDKYPPAIDLMLPVDNAELPWGFINFECNSTDLYPLVNGSLWGNFSGSWGINKTTNIPYDNDEYSLNYSIELDPGAYEWNCQFCDSNEQCNFSNNNYNFILESEPTITPTMHIRKAPELKKNILLLIMFLVIYSGIIIVLYHALNLEKKWE